MKALEENKWVRDFFEALQQLNTNLSNQAIESDSSAQEFINAGS
jgi:hypothetical protein